MQPDQPSPFVIVGMMLAKMMSAAGAKEAELQGASSIMRVNAATGHLIDVQGET